MHLALYQPDIPQNLGSILRLCACMEVVCHVIEPCGFVLDDRRMKRVAMDYTDHAQMQRHASWESFQLYVKNAGARLVLLTTKARASCYDFVFLPSDILLLGRESAGVPESVAAAVDVRLRIPIASHTRSLNLVQAASIALGEAVRQTR